MKSLLAHAPFYWAFKHVLVSPRQMAAYAQTHVRAQAGARILDIGCGLADILDYLPDTCEYTGFDANPDYIRQAQARHAGRGASFRCERVHEATLKDPGGWDLVLANGVLHHLDDGEGRELFALARAALKSGGRLVTLDGVYVAGQSEIARWLIARDRGRFVRTKDQYEALAHSAFDQVECFVKQGLLRIPYTHLVLVCSQGRAPAPAQYQL